MGLPWLFDEAELGYSPKEKPAVAQAMPSVVSDLACTLIGVGGFLTPFTARIAKSFWKSPVLSTAMISAGMPAPSEALGRSRRRLQIPPCYPWARGSGQSRNVKHRDVPTRCQDSPVSFCLDHKTGA